MPNSSTVDHTTDSGRTTPAGTRPRPNPIRRRQWLHQVATDRRLTSGAKTWLHLVAARSNDAGKPVYGLQSRQATDLGRSDRTVRRYRSEAEELGYIACYRARPERGPDGTYRRRLTNRYYLCRPKIDATAPRRRDRAPYCVVRKPRSDLPDSDGRWNPPLGSGNPATDPESELTTEVVRRTPPDDAARAAAARHLAEARAILAGGSPG